MEKEQQTKTFYHGTSTVFAISQYIIPTSKSNKKSARTLYKRKTARVYVTDDIDAANFYAQKSAKEKGGEPIVYIVEPDRMTLVRVSKTDFATSNAKIIGKYDAQ